MRQSEHNAEIFVEADYFFDISSVRLLMIGNVNYTPEELQSFQDHASIPNKEKCEIA